MGRLNFKCEATSTGTRARAGTFRTLHNEVKTPTFMPVATVAAARAQSNEALENCGAQVLLSNTYHLLLRPGPEVFERACGIHKFMKWPRSVLTDSGGFQMFSLPNSVKMTEEGATFRSYVDGKWILLSPETSISMQKSIGSDIIMVLDQCIPSISGHAQALEAMELTHRWAKRSLAARGDSPQSIFGIVQGACFEDLRKQSADFITSLPFDGFAIGGLAVGETKAQREDFTELTADLLPRDMPRYLMGVGTPIDLLEGVHRGVDMFDCILPTALAQQGVSFTSLGRVDLKRGVYKFSDDPLDPACACPTCAKYTRGYLHHLLKCGEMYGWQLVGIHNLYFYQNLMRECRLAIFEDRFLAYYKSMQPVLLRGDSDHPPDHPKQKIKKPRFPSEIGNYEIIQSASGFHSIRQKNSGETMHSVSEPASEARALYIDQSDLKRKLSSADESELIIWDVGLGAATNAMAAIHCFEEVPSTSKSLKIISFESDLDSLRLALMHPLKFTYLKHPAPVLLLKNGEWKSKCGRLSWQLVEGDFRKKITQSACPDLIFYDPFSYKTDSELWSLECFQKIAHHLGDHAAELYTYSASTRVRAALLVAGFFVAKGVGSGPKVETTLAFLNPLTSTRAPFSAMLSDEWLKRWERSQAQWPDEIIGEQAIADFIARMRSHPQFTSQQ